MHGHAPFRSTATQTPRRDPVTTRDRQSSHSPLTSPWRPEPARTSQGRVRTHAPAAEPVRRAPAATRHQEKPPRLPKGLGANDKRNRPTRDQLGEPGHVTTRFVVRRGPAFSLPSPSGTVPSSLSSAPDLRVGSGAAVTGARGRAERRSPLPGGSLPPLRHPTRPSPWTPSDG